MAIPKAKKAQKPVLLKCLKLGCPRTRRIDKDDLMPKRTVVVQQDCPWHLKEGNKDYEIRYFDKNGKSLVLYEVTTKRYS